MGTNQFQREYIEYLQDRNTELIGRLNHMKETYENKILSKDFNKHYLMSTLEDVSNICTQIPKEIDLFFDKMSAAMSVLKNILLRKSEMVQLVEKISKALNTPENCRSDLFPMDSSGLLKEPILETRSVKTGTVKVSPMINGHIISTEPRIYLSRVPEIFTPTRRKETHKLSPIIEASPELSSNSSRMERKSFREITIPVERLNLNKLSFSYMSEESPRSRFKGPKTWKKSLSSGKYESNNPRNRVFLENKDLEKKIPIGEIENVDPLEGPSWLHNDNETNSSPSRFMDYRRRKHRYATVFDKNEEYVSCGRKMLKLSREEEERKNDDDSRDGDEEDDDDDDDDDADGDGDGDGDDVDDDGDDDYNDDDDRNNGDDGNENDDDYEDEEYSESSRNANNGKKNFREFIGRIRESSVDLFCESYSSECEESVSPFKNITGRKKTSESIDRSNTSDRENSFKRESASFEANVKKDKRTSPPKRSTERDGESRSVRSSKSRRCHSTRRLSRSIFGGTKSKTSLEKTSRKSECDEKRWISSNQSGRLENKRKSLSVKDVDREAFVKLEDCMVKKENLSDRSKEKRPSSKNASCGGSKSPAASSLPETEGRKRRKAAPTVLVEPKLNSKLRRN